MTISLTDIYRYPIKSMGGGTLDATNLTANGIPGDRCWTVKDEVRGGIKGGKRFPSLMDMHAQLVTEPTANQTSPQAQITLADGRTLNSLDENINDQLSDAIGSPVSLWPLLPKEELAHYQRIPPEEGVDQETALREVFARNADEPLPDLSTFPPDLFTYESPPGTYFDAFPLLIMSQAALSAMAQHRPESNFDVRRFRPNLVVQTPEDGFAENQWVGKTALLGDAVLKIEMACPRCVMTTHGFGDISKDPGVMRALVQANNGNLGVYASVITPGKVSIGDVLQIQG